MLKLLSHDYLIPFLWAGMILGLSFIAAPSKFSALNIDRIQALEVGQTTFNIFNKVEWAMALLIAMTILKKKHRNLKWIVRLVLVLLAIETFYLLPALREQLFLIQKGVVLEQSFHHNLYILIEVIKIAVLVFLGIKQIGTNTIAKSEKLENIL